MVHQPTFRPFFEAMFEQKITNTIKDQSLKKSLAFPTIKIMTINNWQSNFLTH